MQIRGRSIGSRQLGEVFPGGVVGGSLGVVSGGVVGAVAGGAVVAEAVSLGGLDVVGESLVLGAVRDCGCDAGLDVALDGVPDPAADSAGVLESGSVVAGSVGFGSEPEVAGTVESGGVDA
ncbi:MAG TPA: hypothetical protein VHC49_27160 [Mycobacteriales bacterium]|nr:hypothetical protein [Mycobacteriales bacterium]